MATYETEIHTGGGGWQQDTPLEINITNRKDIVPDHGAPATGTSVTWSSTNGNGSVTFFDGGTNFEGTAQFPNEGPVGYRGRRTN